MSKELIHALEQNNIDGIKTLVASGSDINATFIREYSTIMPMSKKEARGKRMGEIWNNILNIGTLGFFARMNETLGQASTQNENLENATVKKIMGDDNNDNALEQIESHIYSPLSYAVKNNNMGLTKTLLKLAADIDITFDSDKPHDTEIVAHSPLGWAIINSNLAMVKFLIDSGASVNKNFQHGTLTPLRLAIMHNNFNIASILLERGANSNITTASKQTHLGHAIMQGNIKILKLLIEYKADVNAKFEGYTPLGYSVVSSHLEIAKILVASGADVSATFIHNEENHTPLSYATKEGHSKMVELLTLSNTKIVKKS